ncbi:MAG: zinc-dependent alcohol dehydrogenase family protein [Gammaproteobacteria bacterium]|nr:zinc-dependent alcohol dehydrogenase family protein [Gammaproteobacteria bacterium]MBU1480452.1 zinc-dependent alcohol dehydrogenase family protein [Gammaproteobacteria bacterium]
MKAILATAPGSTEVLQLRDIPVPELPTPHHILVKLAAAGVNPIDTKLRAKPLYFPDKLPAILGCDGAGVVEAVGSSVSRFRIGDAVFFCNGGIGGEPGNYAEYTTLHEDYCAAKPDTLSLQESAALPLVFITAWESLVERGRLQASQTVLIHAGAGGVGHVAVQIAHRLGARVAVTVSYDNKAEVARSLGAEKIINYRTQDFVQEILDWTGGRGVDIVFDTVGGETFLKSLHAARVYGKVISLLSTPLSLADTQLARLRNLTLGYDLMLTPQAMGLTDDRIHQRKILEQGAAMVDAGKLKVHVSHRLPLEQVTEAHRMIEAGGMIGKIVLTMD